MQSILLDQQRALRRDGDTSSAQFLSRCLSAAQRDDDAAATSSADSAGSVRLMLYSTPMLRCAACRLDAAGAPRCVGGGRRGCNRGLVQRLVPERYNETIGVQHIKVRWRVCALFVWRCCLVSRAQAYVFDDTVILSGANLNQSYFTSRQVRARRCCRVAVCGGRCRRAPHRTAMLLFATRRSCAIG